MTAASVSGSLAMGYNQRYNKLFTQVMLLDATQLQSSFVKEWDWVQLMFILLVLGIT